MENYVLPSLEFVVEESVFAEDEEVVLLVALAGLTLHVPVVLASHLVLVFLKSNVTFYNLFS